jgi:hypothetical protein
MIRDLCLRPPFYLLPSGKGTRKPLVSNLSQKKSSIPEVIPKNTNPEHFFDISNKLGFYGKKLVSTSETSKPIDPYLSAFQDSEFCILITTLLIWATSSASVTSGHTIPL